MPLKHLLCDSVTLISASLIIIIIIIITSMQFYNRGESLFEPHVWTGYKSAYVFISEFM